MPLKHGCFAALVAGLALLTAAPWAVAIEAADSSERARQAATQAIPFAKLNEETQRKVLSVIENPSVFRRMPTKTVDCDPDLFAFLIRNPEVVVNIWQLMGVSNMTAERMGPYSWNGNDGSGTVCNVELIYGTDNLHILYGEGYYEGPLFRKKMYGRCVLCLRAENQVGQDGHSYVGSQLDVFLVVDNAGVDILARTLAPLVGKTADSNFEESAKFISRLSQTAEKNAPGMARLAEKLEKCEPPVREQFAQVSSVVNQRAAVRDTRLEIPRAAMQSTIPRRQ